MENNINFTVLTGASQGFGRALAFEIAKRNFNLILVALPNEGLDDLAGQLKQFGIEVVYYEVDLTVKSELLEFTDWVNRNYRVNFLINNAGVGGSRKILESKIDEIDNLIKLNITATTLITHQLLPNLLSREERAYILNVSSMAAYCPIPYKTVYPASKRFVHDFSRGLCEELKETNVFVSVVHPGPMMTNENVTNRIKNHGFWGNIGILSPEKAAYLTMKQLYRKDSSILLGWFNSLLWLFMVILPVRIKLPLLAKTFRKQAVSETAFMSSLKGVESL